jgi:hypothetical protein
MQATTVFALFIGVIAVVHFLTLIAERFRPTKRKKNIHTTRKDWYCFFSPNVLVGEDNTEEKSVIPDTQLDTVRQRQQRRQQEQHRLILKT